ncbi:MULTISPECIES: L-2-hydroxyglutarate oxidase [Streptomyces]|uniref:L-2-hydroxyglutarate oxidase n=9 Tax=Streptomyces rimosus TaxID=1927 RepID=L8EVZ2_STRR1|nr:MULTISPECIES: L-2-hydroxyglutarate oxidase [Streptomyces]KOG79219.1 hydroxyglutarate oxidase [Kitasatospora aureofaciens]MYT48291.1 L-2-hydroxyglutarate oxidase [Streptomyces sp. SID5471]KEF21265.1 hydroxyglutarate oxidase [Streptomyces rimosus]KOT41209.1 hydroxyglutarate oxidase [Streptomyces sp. NRRL WC-3701]QDA05918.1 L-2-hydroxyglutarate oxidase [Streptomyces rimosus]
MAYDCDVLVIGAGIVGLSTAYAITRAAPGARVVVLEKEPGPARHQTGRNSGVIHSGIYYPPGSLKARFALQGSAEMVKFCLDHAIPHEVTGKLIVATDRAELPRLHSLIQRGREHGIPVRELGPAQIAQYEPEVSGLAAIHVGTTGITDFGAVARCLATLATEAGAHIVYGSEVTAIGRRAGRVAVRVSSGGGMGAGRIAGGVARTPVDTGRGAGRASADTGRVAGEVSRAPADTERVPGEAGCAPTDAERAFGDAPHTPADALRASFDRASSAPASSDTVFRARVLINCAGLHCDRIARLAGDAPGMRIVPFRGEYHTLAPARASLVRGLVYPVPDPAFPFLGVHLTRGIDGSVHIGPNAVPALAREGYDWRTVRPADLAGTLAYPGSWHIARRHWRYGAGELHRSLSRRAFTEAVRRLLPAIREEDLRPSPAGVRAQAVLPDGTLADDFLITETPSIVHVLNAPSPAATASLPIGREIAGRALGMLEGRLAEGGVASG